MRRLLLVGAGGHGRVVADLAECLGFATIDFVDEQWPEISRNGAWPVVGSIEGVPELAGQYDAAIAASGTNTARLGIHRRLKGLAAASPVLIHPSAVVSRHARLGSGSVVLANAVVNAFATIGEAAILNTGCTVDHDCRLGDGVHVSPGAHLAGQVEVGDCAWIGIGASIRQLARIGSQAVVGAGSTVVSDVEVGATVFGTPARARAPKQVQ